jgi:hypothetical protein
MSSASASRTPPPSGRRGFTPFRVGFIALIVVVAVGLAWSGSAYVQNAAERTTCQNRLKIIGTSISNYADTNQSRLPPQSETHPAFGPASFFFTLLPFVESTDIHSRARAGGSSWSNGIHRDVLQAYLCPADASHTNGLAPNGWAVTSFSTNTLLFASAVMTDSAGNPVCRSKYKIGNVPDGTSNTIALVERYGVNPTSGYSSLWAAPCGGAWGWPDTSHAYGMWSTGLPEPGVPPGQARYDVPNSGHTLLNILTLDGSVRGVTALIEAPPSRGCPLQACWRTSPPTTTQAALKIWLYALDPEDGQPKGGDWD